MASKGKSAWVSALAFPGSAQFPTDPSDHQLGCSSLLLFETENTASVDACPSALAKDAISPLAHLTKSFDDLGEEAVI
jgi:hypothetical protein